MLVNCTCEKCKLSIGIVQYSDYYYCKTDYGKYTCITCYENNNQKCDKCNNDLVFHNSDDTKRFQKNNNLMF